MSKPNRSPPLSIDDPAISRVVFYPRRTRADYPESSDVQPVLFQLDDKIAISGRFLPFQAQASTIVFFHGNGEVSADYDMMGPQFNRSCSANFLVLDYRGYGESTGTPSATAMIQDARKLFPRVQEFLAKKHCTGPVVVMGRSLGSASAIEIASHYAIHLAGIVLESGFSRVEPLLSLFGVPSEVSEAMDLTSLANAEKLEQIDLPLLVIHGQDDSLLPAYNGRELHAASPAKLKRLVVIPEAEHNTILLYPIYFEALRTFLQELAR